MCKAGLLARKSRTNLITIRWRDKIDSKWLNDLLQTQNLLMAAINLQLRPLTPKLVPHPRYQYAVDLLKMTLHITN